MEGILEFEGEGEVTGNIAGTPDNIDVFAAEGAKINRNSSMVTQFVDVGSDAYYIEPVKWAVEQGITNGTSDTIFFPRKNLHPYSDCDFPLESGTKRINIIY